MIIGSILGLYRGHTGIVIPHSLLRTSKQEAHRGYRWVSVSQSARLVTRGVTSEYQQKTTKS